MPALTPQPTFLLPNFPRPYQEKIKIFNENGKSEQIPAIRHSRCNNIFETQPIEYLDKGTVYRQVKNRVIYSFPGNWVALVQLPNSTVLQCFYILCIHKKKRHEKLT